MKKYIFLFFIFIGFVAQAQYGNMNRRQRQRDYTQQTQQKTFEPNFKIKKHLGIVVYDIKKAAKKSSIKLSSKIGKEFSNVLTTYNKNIKGITRINSFLLNSTKEMVESFQKKAVKTGDYSDQPKVQKKMNENLKALSETLEKEDKKLDKTMKEILSGKQYKKWIKYNKKLYKIFPEEI